MQGHVLQASVHDPLLPSHPQLRHEAVQVLQLLCVYQGHPLPVLQRQVCRSPKGQPHCQEAGGTQDMNGVASVYISTRCKNYNHNICKNRFGLCCCECHHDYMKVIGGDRNE